MKILFRPFLFVDALYMTAFKGDAFAQNFYPALFFGAFFTPFFAMIFLGVDPTPVGGTPKLKYVPAWILGFLTWGVIKVVVIKRYNNFYETVEKIYSKKLDRITDLVLFVILVSNFAVFSISPPFLIGLFLLEMIVTSLLISRFALRSGMP
jgi:hypothetical protein